MKSKGIIIAVLIILLLGGGYFLIGKKGTSSPASTNNTTGSETSSGSKSLKDLLSAGIAQKCTYSITDESGSSEGTTYVSGGKVRSDFTTTTSGKTTKSHIISDGITSWIWTDGETTGFKMTVEAEQVSPNSTTQNDKTVQTGADWNEKIDYKCSAWVTDGAYFTPPSEVKFTDFSDLLKSNPSR